MKEQHTINILAKVYWISGKTQRIQRHSTRRISAFFQAANWSRIEKVYLRVSYGEISNNLGEKVIAFNDGEYSERSKFYAALNGFTEK